jgi:hypothetical protein
VPNEEFYREKQYEEKEEVSNRRLLLDKPA